MTETPGLVSIVIPVYNGSATIAELAERLLAVFRSMNRACEILLVNDGSPDNSWEVIRALADAHPQVRGLNLMRNFGQHNALLAGIRQASGEITVTMDDDLQNPPEEVPKLLEGVAGGHDVVYGVPDEGRHGMFRDFASFAAKFGLRVGLGFKHANYTSAFRAFRTELRDAFAQFDAKYVSMDVLLTWATTDFSSVVVQHNASLVGFLFTAFGAVVLVYSLVVYLIYDRAVPGFTFLASIIAIFAGVQLFSLGIIGEYIGRIHQRALNQPCYVISETTPRPQEAES
jgi:undecaprenyl-phosphate 4-deoxy-4-formamido-L-arabinose transferase